MCTIVRAFIGVHTHVFSQKVPVTYNSFIYFTDQSPWEPYSHTAGLEITYILHNWKVYCYIYNDQPPDSNLSQQLLITHHSPASVTYFVPQPNILPSTQFPNILNL